MNLTNTQWRTLMGVVAAVASFALASDLHPEVVLSPIIQFALGAILVALAAIQAPQDKV